MHRRRVPRHTAEVQFGVGLAATMLLGVGLALMAWAVLPGVVPGWSTSVVESGSMRPQIREGDAVVVRPAPTQLLDPGAVILFDIGAGPTLHRVERTEDGHYVTRGDANGSSDSGLVATEQVDGVGTILVPWVGQPLRWHAEGQWFRLAALALAALAAIHTAHWSTDRRFDPWAEGSADDRRGRSQPPLRLGGDPFPAEIGLLPPSVRRTLIDLPASVGP